MYGMLSEETRTHSWRRKHCLTFWFLWCTAAGAVKDLSFLIDILPAYLFPNDERTIGEWVLAGFSLGGHATWLALRQGAHTRLLLTYFKSLTYYTLSPSFSYYATTRPLIN